VKLEFGVVSGLMSLKSQGFLLGVITNQSIIDRGITTRHQVNLVNQRVEELLAIENLGLDFIYVCPHVPWALCNCRKPKAALGLQAVKDFSIDIDHSFMIGDQPSDTAFGINLGVKTVQIGESRDINATPHKYASNMLDAATWILESSD
jgi:D-glycero-D-manno-heptose 1,7-bisphosphate phosphatase